MSAADEILAELLVLDVEHPRYLYNGMRLCYWCGNAYQGKHGKGEFPSNHTPDCPWAAARTWAKKNGKKIRAARERREAIDQAAKGAEDGLAPTPSANPASPDARGPLDAPVGSAL